MAAGPPPFTKLPGRGLRRAVIAISATRCRLWLAADHLLAVDSTIASEEYRRFYFRDIEAFIVRRTARRQVWNWILGALLLFTAGPFFLAWQSQGSGGFFITALILAGFWSVVLLINTLRGPTCATHIRTAVQLEELPSLARLRVARRVLALVEPLIVEAQGATTPKELSAAPWTSAPAPAGGASALPSGSRPLRVARGRLHGALFGLLVAEGGLTATAYSLLGQPISFLSLLAMLGGGIICVTALIRQRETHLSASVRTMAKVALGYYILKCLIGFGYMMVFAVRHPGTPVRTGLEMVGERGFSEMALGSAGMGTVIGLIGFVVLFRHFRRPSTPTAV